MSSYTAEWNKLYDRYYRKRELYQMQWSDVDLSKFMVAGAPYGGPIAMIRDERKIVLLGSQPLKPVVSIYTSAGALISSFPWTEGRLVKMGWTDKERLLTIQEDGQVNVYSVHGELLNQFSLGKEVRDDCVADAHIWGTGLVVLTRANQLHCVADLDEPKPHRLADPLLSAAPSAMAVIEPQFTLSRTVEVLLGTADTIQVVDSESYQDQLLTNGPYKKLAVSPTGKILACFTASGNLWVLSTDFTKNLSEFATKSNVPPQQLVWCGNDSVVLYWDKILLMVGPYGDWIKYTYDEPLVLIPECDGVRIITNSKCEFLQRVPDCTVQIFKIGSCAPAAMLYDALELFEKQDSKADDNIRNIRDKLSDAVDACIDAAAHEFNPQTQRSLLKASSYGKCFCEFYNADTFVDMCKILRVMNTLRSPEIGIPITYQQYVKLTADVMIDRLINRHHHLLALRICEYLGIRTERVLIHWACAKIKKATGVSDPEVRDIIVDKLRGSPGISYAEIASTAYCSGRPKLATMLLDHEPRAADQVPLLISMQEDEVALVKAIEGGDTDLVYLAMLHIKRKRPLPEFLRIILPKPVARDLFVAYCREQDPELLKTFFYTLEQPQEAASIAVLEAYKCPEFTQRRKGLEAAHEFFEKSKDSSLAKATEEHIKLLDIQREIEQATGERIFLDCSLNDTIYYCFVHNQQRRALRLKNDFKVSDKRFCWLKVRGLAAARDWLGLEKLSKEKKVPPIGFQPFVEVCIKEGATAEAIKYIPKVEGPSRVELFVRIGRYREAAEAAIQLKDPESLMMVRSRCKDHNTEAFIDQLAVQHGMA